MSNPEIEEIKTLFSSHIEKTIAQLQGIKSSLEEISSSLDGMSISTKNIESELAKREKSLSSLSNIETRLNDWNYWLINIGWAFIGICFGLIVVLVAQLG
jgi:hypothetical protein